MRPPDPCPPPRNGNASWFTRFARGTAQAAGRPTTFMAAALTVVVWASLGPLFHYSEDWQLVINTGTTIITFLMVFLIQNTQNRDSQAMHLKLDELIRAMQGAKNSLLDLDHLTDEELEKLRDGYAQLAAKAEKRLKHPQAPTKMIH